ncbi:hypothetical protein A7A08_02793 [Methyloligella halotolerans]|uniref:Uncharacterized protein n=1 Tax=Methyloligella halotolerans TaxID=1177755 RepID=A0A1E2RW98_9HYPH|nr:hypothetical protein [Methyloligella halotolerans]ODA66395.1 hypothetical protein A7A08_02793 [Methyloligella halotolerans]
MGTSKKEANQNVAYLRNMLNNQTQVASAEPEPVPEPPARDFGPFGPDGHDSRQAASQPVRMAAAESPAGNVPARPAGRLPQSLQTPSSQAAIEAERSQSSGSSVAPKGTAPTPVASRNIPIPASVERPAVAMRYDPSANQATTVAKKSAPPRTAIAQADPAPTVQSPPAGAVNPAAAASLLRSDVQ